MPSVDEEKRTDLLNSRTFLAQTFAVILVCAAGVVGYALRPAVFPDVSSLIFFLVIIVVTEALPIELPRVQGTVSVGFAMCYSAVLMFGPFWGGLLTATGSLRRRELTGQVHIVDVLFNRAQLFLAAVSGGLIFNLMADSIFDEPAYMVALATMAGGIAYFTANVIATVSYLSIKTGIKPLSLIASDVSWLVPSYMGLLPIAYLNVAVYHAVGTMGVLFFLLPLLVGRYAFKMYSELRDIFLSTISALATALEARDPHTSGHAERVAHYAVRIAEAMKLSDERVELLQYVAILHDIGKIGISDSVLQKPGRFTAEERELMKSHSEIGANILKKVEALREGASWVLYHHERVDGFGYPEGLSGEEIPLEARILAVADAFDAMMSERPYKRAFSLEEARDEIERCRGSQFDPEIAGVLLDLIEDGELVHGEFSAQTDGEQEEQAHGGDTA